MCGDKRCSMLVRTLFIRPSEHCVIMISIIKRHFVHMCTFMLLHKSLVQPHVIMLLLSGVNTRMETLTTFKKFKREQLN